MDFAATIRDCATLPSPERARGAVIDGRRRWRSSDVDAPVFEAVDAADCLDWQSRCASSTRNGMVVAHTVHERIMSRCGGLIASRDRFAASVS